MRTQGIVLSRGGVTFDMRSKHLDCPDWADLRKSARRSGANRDLPGGGVGTRSRFSHDVHGGLPVRVDGSWNSDSTPRAGSHDDLMAAMNQTVDALMAFLEDDEPCTVTLHRAGSLAALEGVLQVDDAGSPSLKVWRARWAFSFVLPEGLEELT